MKNKLTLIIFFAVMASLTTVQAYLEDNFYFTMAPNSTSCLFTALPTDLNFLDDDNYTTTINSDFDTNLKFIQTIAGKFNVVKIPICFSTENKKDGDYSDYNITVSGKKFKSFEWVGGICISNIDGANKISNVLGKNPCEIVNGYSDLFWMELDQEQIITSPGQEETINLEIWPFMDLDLDISISTNAVLLGSNTSYFRLKQYERRPIEIKIKTPVKGEYFINVNANAALNRQYCDLPFCKKSAEAKVSSDGIRKTAGWSFIVLPKFLSAYNTKPIEYVAIIENNQEDMDFSVGLDAPPGLNIIERNQTQFIRKGERKEFRFNVTISDDKPQRYAIDFMVKGDAERSITAYLSLYESADDVRREWISIRDKVNDKERAELDDLVEKYLTDVRNNGFDPDQYRKIKDKINEARTGKPAIRPTPSQPQVSDQSQQIIFIAIPVVAIIILVVLLFAKKKAVK